MRTCGRRFNRHFVRAVGFQYDPGLHCIVLVSPSSMEPIVRFPQLLLASLRDAPMYWALGLVVFIVLLALGVWRLRGRSRRRLQRIIRGLGTAALSDVVLPDPVEGQLHVDYLVLSAQGVLLIDVKDYRGMLFGGERTDIWTQVVDGRSYKFDNPLYGNRAREGAVRAIAPGLAVRSIVVFTDAGRFPRQRPAGVYMLGELTAEFAPHDQVVPASVQAGWERLVERIRAQG